MLAGPDHKNEKRAKKVINFIRDVGFRAVHFGKAALIYKFYNTGQMVGLFFSRTGNYPISEGETVYKKAGVVTIVFERAASFIDAA